MIRDKVETDQIVIDLTGPNGNAFALLAIANRLGKKLGLDSNMIIEEMRSGDYENLVKIFDNYFGDFVILER
jgi:hypothetical protein